MDGPYQSVLQEEKYKKFMRLWSWNTTKYLRSIRFKPDYHTRQRISLEYIPIELPDREVKTFLSEYVTILGKTYYPGNRHSKHFTTGARVYQCIKLQKHLPRHLYQFSRYLCICYESWPKSNLTLPDTNLLYTEDTPIPENHNSPTNISTEEEILPGNTTYIQKLTCKCYQIKEHEMLRDTPSPKINK